MIGLMLTCAALIALIGIEIIGAIPPTEGPDAPVAPMPVAPDAPPEESDDSRVAHILARPLFTPGRHPAPQETGPDASGLAADVRLAGILLAPGVRSALIVRAGQAAATELGIGDAIDGWRITAIDPAGIALTHAERQIFVEPTSAALANRGSPLPPSGQPGLPPPGYLPPALQPSVPGAIPSSAPSPVAKKRKPR